MELNELRDRAYKTACEHGFHEEELSDRHFLMLVITELSEAVEADRKCRRGDAEKYIKAMNAYNGVDKSICFERHFNKYIKDSVADELADAVIRLLDLAWLRDIELNIGDKTMFFMTIDFCFKYFPESIFKICMLPETTYQLDARSDKEKTSNIVHAMIASIFALAKYKDIDLLWHINEKMKYNELRPNKHGKLY